jgi:DNA-binding IclR family transcriptional regulator
MKKKSNTSNYQIRSIDRALDILEAFTAEQPELELNDLCERIGLPKSTVFRILSVLEHRDYVQRDGDSSPYRIGFRAFQVGNRYLSGRTVMGATHPLMKELASRFPQSAAHLAVLSPTETRIVYVDIVSLNATLPLNPVGSSHYAHCTALGKCLLAGLSEEALARRLAHIELPQLTAHTITDVEKLSAQLQQIREQGYAMDDEESLMGNLCVAVPVKDRRGVTVAALSTSHAKRAMAKDISEIIDYMDQIARRASQTLGYDNSSHPKNQL